MFGPVIRFPSNNRLELRGTPLWVPAVLLLILAFTAGLAWVFFLAEEMWFETGSHNRLYTDGRHGFYAASWPVAAMTLVLGLPWLFALSRVRLRSVVIDGASQRVTVRPIGAVPLLERHLPFDDITGFDRQPRQPPVILRLFGNGARSFRPVAVLVDGGIVALVGQGLSRNQCDKILHMAGKVVPHAAPSDRQR